MAKPRQVGNKRDRERNKRQQKEAKARRKAERDAAKADRGPEDTGDPDLAGIIPGPQPSEDEGEDEAPGDEDPSEASAPGAPTQENPAGTT